MGELSVYDITRNIANTCFHIMRLITILSFILLPVIAKAQLEYFNSEQFWGKLVLREYGDKVDISEGDTVIIVASNRVKDTASFRFFPEERDGKQIKYFVVYSHQGKWQVQPVPSLAKAVTYMPEKNKDWVVYTEGMGKFFTSDLDRGMSLAGQYGVNVILMDYPSITAHKKRLANYFFAMKNAKIAYKDFTPVLDTVRMMQEKGQLGREGVNLFFHSMGNIVMRQIVRNGRLGQINASVWVNNLILNAPCVPQHGHRKWVDKIRFAKRIYIHYNPHDYTLGGAYLLSKRNQLGMKVKGPVSDKAVYVNFNTLARKGHSNFLNLYGRNSIPEAADRHYRVLFHGDAVDTSDTSKYRPTGYRGIGFDILL